jgi:hypothetical protein
MLKPPERAAAVPVNQALSPKGKTLAILDANVLLPPRLSDILFDLFLEGLYLPRWTASIEAEFIKHFGHIVLAKDKNQSKTIKAAPPDPEHIAKAKNRLHCFRSAVGPQFEVLLYDSPSYEKQVPQKVNAGDVHVASAALVLQALSKEQGCVDKVFIVSNNLAHLAVKEMMAIGIHVTSPGAFIDALNKAAPRAVERALLKTINDLQAPPFTRTDMLRLLVLHKAKESADFYANKWNEIFCEKETAVDLKHPAGTKKDK